MLHFILILVQVRVFSGLVIPCDRRPCYGIMCALGCGQPPPFGQRVPTEACLTYPVGSRVKYRCVDGHSQRTGLSYCGGGGLWSEPDLHCTNYKSTMKTSVLPPLSAGQERTSPARVRTKTYPSTKRDHYNSTSTFTTTSILTTSKITEVITSPADLTTTVESSTEISLHRSHRMGKREAPLRLNSPVAVYDPGILAAEIIGSLVVIVGFLVVCLKICWIHVRLIG